MKFGLRFCNTGAFVEPGPAIELAEAAEEAGFESLWAIEHTVVPRGYAPNAPQVEGGKMAGGVEDVDMPDPIVWLSFVAARTSRINVATGILILPQHKPLHVAKQAATLHRLAGGRFMLGVGVGWMPEEFQALGASFEHRGRFADEAIQALRRLWADSPAEFHGAHFDLPPPYCGRRPGPTPRHTPPAPVSISRRSIASRVRRAGTFRSSSAATPKQPRAAPGGWATAISPRAGRRRTCSRSPGKRPRKRDAIRQTSRSRPRCPMIGPSSPTTGRWASIG